MRRGNNFRTLRISLLIALVSALLIYVNKTAADKPPIVEVAAGTTLPSRAAKGDLTVGDILLLSSQSEPTSRREALNFIIQLRNDYISACLMIVSSGSEAVDKKSVMAAYNLLGQLRPTDAATVDVAANDITTNFQVPSVASDEDYPSYSAADMIERTSLPALPQLSRLLAHIPSVSKNNLQDVRSISLVRTYAILGPATSSWLLDKSLNYNKPKANVLKQDAKFLSTEIDAKGTQAYTAPFYITGLPLLNGGYDQDAMKGEAPNSTKIVWLNTTVANTEKNIKIATEVWTLLEYSMVQMLIDSPYDRDNRYSVYPLGFRTDIIAALGSMRCDMAPWVIWDALISDTSNNLLDKSPNNKNKVFLRSLCQIDIPCVKMLADKIATEWDINHRRTATYALSRIMGKYSVDFIEREIAIRQDAAQNDQELHGQYLDQVKRLTEMLELGKEKHWFTGDYYGAHDPHAYDLVFDDTPTPAKTP